MMSDAQIITINEALALELQRRGLQVVTGNSEADMFLSWRFVPDESATMSTFDPATQKVTKATLYVDMIDPVIVQTVWRGSFRPDLRDQSETDMALEYSRQAAGAILADFPPGQVKH